MGWGDDARFYWSSPLLRSKRGAICVQVRFISGICQTQELMSLRSLSIAFDDASLTIRVTGKPLRWRDRHFPAPAELIVGKPPSDVIRTRCSTREENSWIRAIWDCVKHPTDCAHDLIEHLTIDIDTADVDGSTINFNGENNEAHKRYWPPE